MIKIDNLVTAIYSAVDTASSSMMEKNLELLSTFFEVDEANEPTDDGGVSIVDSTILGPKTVNVEFPYETAAGPQIQTVSVPFISMVPISMVQIEELSFKTSLDCDDVMCSFAAKDIEGSSGLAAECQSEHQQENKPVCQDIGQGLGHAEINIVVRQKENPQGLQQLIAGYDKILKSQIPG